MIERKLRPHQKRAVTGVWEAWEDDPKNKPVVVCPTGGGKSFIANYILERTKRPVVISHTGTLRDQLAETIPCALSLTIQEINAKGPRGAAVRKLIKKESEAACVDECHRALATEYVGFLETLETKLFGLTATPVRMDGKPLGDLFNRMVLTANYSELIELGHLLPMDVWSPEYSRSQQEKLNIRIDPVAAYLNHAREGRDPHAIWFASSVKECNDSVKRLTAAGVKAAVLTAKSSKATRKLLIAQFKAGALEVLASPVLLAEGFDATIANTVVCDRSAGHISLFLQMCGRALRPHPGQTRALLIDPRDACSIHSPPTTDREYDLDGTGMRVKRTRAKREQEEAEEKEKQERLLVEARFQLALDKVIGKLERLIKEAAAMGVKPGWAMHEMAREIGVDAPHMVHAKSRAVCRECHKRVTVGETIAWTGARETFHANCWLEMQMRETPSARRWSTGAMIK